MKTRIIRLVFSLVVVSFSCASIAADPVDASKTTVSGKFTLPVYPGSTLENSGRGVSGGMAYRYHSNDSVDVVYAWYRGKLPGGQERVKAPGKLISYAVSGSQYVNVMVTISNKGGSDISLSP